MTPAHPDAEVFLLSKFLRPSKTDYYDDSEWLEPYLQDNPRTVIQRFEREGLIEAIGLSELARRSFTVPELREMLTELGISIRGRKADLIAALIDSEPEHLRNRIGPTTWRVCTERGGHLASGFLEREHAGRKQAETEVVSLIREKRFHQASMAVARFESGKLPPRGFVDWSNHNPKYDVGVLRMIYGPVPAILKKLGPSKLAPLREAAALDYLWGTNAARRWLPPGFDTGVAMDADACARMFMFAGQNRANIENWREYLRQSGFLVRILASRNSCRACQNLNEKMFSFEGMDHLPELPYEHCTHELGCRCTTAIVTTDLMTPEERERVLREANLGPINR